MVLDRYCSQQGYHADRGDDLPGSQPELCWLLERVSEEKPEEVGVATSINALGMVNSTILAHSDLICQEAILRKVHFRKVGPPHNEHEMQLVYPIPGPSPQAEKGVW